MSRVMRVWPVEAEVGSVLRTDRTPRLILNWPSGAMACAILFDCVTTWVVAIEDSIDMLGIPCFHISYLDSYRLFLQR